MKDYKVPDLPDETSICIAADNAILQTWAEGMVKYPNAEWKTRSDQEDLKHAEDHLLCYNHGDVPPNLEDLRHALFRIATVLRRRRDD